jgi:hypothetical protein
MGPAVFCEDVFAYAPDSRFGVDSIPSDSKLGRGIQKFRENAPLNRTKRKFLEQGNASVIRLWHEQLEIWEAQLAPPLLSHVQKEILRGGAGRDAEDCGG